MRLISVSRRAGGLLLATLALPGLASATEPGLQEAAGATVRIEGFGPAVDAATHAGEPGGMRGGTEVDNDVDIDGVVDGNHAENLTSGTNTLAGDAFANANGINTVIQNSGSNVLIQNGMVVTVQFGTPAP